MTFGPIALISAINLPKAGNHFLEEEQIAPSGDKRDIGP
jgi:hypothetical protein